MTTTSNGAGGGGLDVVDVGENDPSTLWLNGGPVDAATAFPDGTTGILSYEIIGEIVSEPLGACCESLTGECTQKLPWICERDGGLFQGVGVACQVCVNNAFTACDSDADCPTCAGGVNPGSPCDPNAQCPGGGECIGNVCIGGDKNGDPCSTDVECSEGNTCTGTATCQPVPPACALSACCVTEAGVTYCEGGPLAGNACTGDGDCSGGTCSGVTQGPGECVTVRTAFCVGAGPGAGDICFGDSDCDVANTCEAPCPDGTVSNGFGSSCTPNCCQQEFSGYDSCQEAIREFSKI